MGRERVNILKAMSEEKRIRGEKGGGKWKEKGGRRLGGDVEKEWSGRARKSESFPLALLS